MNSYSLKITTRDMAIAKHVGINEGDAKVRFEFKDGVIDVEARMINGKTVLVIDSGPEIEVRPAGSRCAVVRFK